MTGPLTLVCTEHGQQQVTHVALRRHRNYEKPLRIQLTCGCVFCWTLTDNGPSWIKEELTNGIRELMYTVYPDPETGD